jgi:hypothetical protein
MRLALVSWYSNLWPVLIQSITGPDTVVSQGRGDVENLKQCGRTASLFLNSVRNAEVDSSLHLVGLLHRNRARE